MPVNSARKVEALRADFRSAAQVADMLGVNRAQITRWLRGAGIDPLNAERIDLLELVWSSLLRIYEREAAVSWLFGINPRLGDRRPIDLIRAGRAEELMRATLYRCFAWREAAAPADPDGPLWFPRMFQGDGRHDNPDVYGCLYLADRPVSCIVEQLAAFRGQRLTASMLRRRGLPLALARLELKEGSELVDLDDPIVLRRERLRPSLVA